MSRNLSLQAHYRRAEALSGLGLNEAALMAYCIGCAADRSNYIPGAVRHDMTRVSVKWEKCYGWNRKKRRKMGGGEEVVMERRKNSTEIIDSETVQTTLGYLSFVRGFKLLSFYK